MGTKSHRRARGAPSPRTKKAVKQVGVRVELSAAPRGATAGTPPEVPVFADFALAGTQVSGDFRCANCGYGAVVQHALPRCPMCGGTVWESRGPRVPRFD
jgi:rubrerythrin